MAQVSHNHPGKAQRYIDVEDELRRVAVEIM